jgi:hypothetical protein
MQRGDLSASNWLSSRAVVGLLVLAGVFYGLRPDWLGYGAMVKAFGGEAGVQGLGIAIAFFVAAAQSWEKAQIRVQMAETLEALHQLLYGKDYRRDREAIEILLAALESQTGANAKTAHEHLVRLTGQNFAQDPKVWRSWWEANKKTFEKSRGS